MEIHYRMMKSSVVTAITQMGRLINQGALYDYMYLNPLLSSFQQMHSIFLICTILKQIKLANFEITKYSTSNVKSFKLQQCRKFLGRI